MTTANLKHFTLLRKAQLATSNTTERTGEEAPLQIKKNAWTKFLEYSSSQQGNRFGWLAVALTLQGCVLAPITIFAIVINGNSMLLWSMCILSFAVTEVTNLAAMPTRITIPVLFGGILLDVVVIVASFIFF